MDNEISELVIKLVKIAMDINSKENEYKVCLFYYTTNSLDVDIFINNEKQPVATFSTTVLKGSKYVTQEKTIQRLEEAIDYLSKYM